MNSKPFFKIFESIHQNYLGIKIDEKKSVNYGGKIRKDFSQCQTAHATSYEGGMLNSFTASSPAKSSWRNGGFAAAAALVLPC